MDVVTLLYLLTIMIEIVIKNAPNKTRIKKGLKLPNPGWATK